ncbi:MAG: HEPN domain-containing protein [candidate division NC10 bacterium]|nr:HEPN domain-containing protein [candidate division NC10 bacterium]
MNSRRLAEDYLRKAKVRVESLGVYFKHQSYDDVIRESQAIVELVLKGLLRLLGVDPPKMHDIGEVLEGFKDRLPRYLAEELPKIVEMSAFLAEERSHAFYGDESGLIPPSELYSREDAETVMSWTQGLVELYERALREG